MSHSRRRTCVVLATGVVSGVALAFAPTQAAVAAPAPPAPARAAPAAPAPAPTAPTSTAAPVTANTWSFVGAQPLQQQQQGSGTTNRPVGGRVTSIAVDPTNSQVVYAGTSGAGVWKSTDSGQHWSPTMNDQASLAIGALAIDPNNHDTIYAGTGEINGSTSQLSQGILKSTTGGTSWSLLGQSTFAGRYIGGLVVDKDDSTHVLAATSIGLYQSPDAGTNWNKDTKLAALMKPDQPGETPSNQVFEVHQDSSQPTTIVASFGDGCSTEVGGIATSNNHGTTWGSVPTYSNANAGRIGVGLGAGGVGYGTPATCNGGNLIGILKTITHASTWTTIPPSTPGFFNVFSGSEAAEDPQAQGDYDNAVGVDPTDANNAVFGGVSSMATTTGGASFVDNGRVYKGGFVHPDFHAFAFTGAKTYYVGNDGGMWSTKDLGGTGAASDYADLNATMQNIEFNTGSYLDSQRILGGTQDNGSPGFFNTPGIALPTMADYGTGDGGVTAIDPTPGANTVYVEDPSLDIQRASRQQQSVTTHVGPCIGNSDPACAESRGFTDAPYVMDPTNSARLVAGAQRVYQTLNGGGAAGGAASWTPISPNLTNTPLKPTGGDILTSIAIGPKGGTTMFTTSGQGRVSRTTNGTSWANITGNLPSMSQAKTFPGPYRFMTQVAFNPANSAEAWVTMSASNQGRLWHTTNAGAPGGTHWTDISGSGLAALPNAPVQTVARDPVNPGTIYVGTATGAFACTTCGGTNPTPSWQHVGTGLPTNVQVNSLNFTADGANLVAWTAGWGMWQLPLSATTPGTPTGVYASPGAQAATVSWTPPAANRITKYTVTAEPGGAQATVAGTATSATVDGLTNGTAYFFTVTATNIAGTGSPSGPSNPVTPPGAPVATSPQFGVPNQTDVFKVGVDGAVEVQWVNGAGRWNGPMDISKPGLARPGARLAVSPQFGVANQTDVFVVSNNQAIQVLWVNGAGRWNGPLAISPAGLAPPGVSLAASPQFGVANQTDVFVVGNDGTTQLVWVKGQGSWNLPLAIGPAGVAPPGATLAASPQFGVANQTDVFRVNNNGSLEVVWVQSAGKWNGPLVITPGHLAPPGAGVAASAQFGVANQTDVFTVSEGGAITVMWVQGGGTWKGPQSISLQGLTPPASPLAAGPQLGVANQTDVFLVGTNGAAQVLWVQGAGRWNAPIGISPAGRSPDGEALAVSPQFGVPNQTDVFFIYTSGPTQVVWVQGAGRWNGPMQIET